MTDKKPPFVYVINILMLAATAGRGILLAIETHNDFLGLTIGLLALYGLLLFTDLAIYQRFRSYLTYYFTIQAGIVITLLLLPLYPFDNPMTTDFFALLFIPLFVQAIFYFPKPASYYWAIALTAASVTTLHIQYGLSDGIKFSLTYILGYAMIFFLAIFYLNAEEAKEELNKANLKLQEYAAKIETLAVAEERNRLARDLHDSVTQSLYSLTLFAEAAADELSAGELDTVGNHLKELRQTSRQALQEMRLMIFELRPPELEKKGLTLALQERLEAVESRAGIETSIQVNFTERLNPKLELGLYSIAREAMNNILKHSKATKVNITLNKENEKLILEIRDNGIGLDDSAEKFSSGLGIKGMQERANQIGASLNLERVPEGGTLLKVEVPNDGNN
ncbi:MAG TPA: sensor histidine kinase [Anaerolineales bacterium]|nr:sensor histidine kinase [Anaerolineales bacterium]